LRPTNTASTRSSKPLSRALSFWPDEFRMRPNRPGQRYNREERT